MPGVAGLNWKGYEITVASVNEFGCGDIFAPAWDLRALFGPNWTELEPKRFKALRQKLSALLKWRFGAELHATAVFGVVDA